MYRKLARKYHADANSQDPQLRDWSHQMMVELNEAYNVLKSSDSRQTYDQRPNGGPTQQSPQSDAASDDHPVFIQTWEQATSILLDGIGTITLNAPTSLLDQQIRQQMTQLAKKNPKHYLRLGVPNEYNMEYLRSAVTNIAADGFKRLEEENIANRVFNIVGGITMLVSLIYALTHSTGILLSIGCAFLSAFVFAMFFGLSMRLLHSALHIFGVVATGIPGWILSGIIATLLVSPSIKLPHIWRDTPQESSPRAASTQDWHYFHSPDGKVSAKLPTEHYSLKPTSSSEVDGYSLRFSHDKHAFYITWATTKIFRFTNLETLPAEPKGTETIPFLNTSASDFALVSSSMKERNGQTFRELIYNNPSDTEDFVYISLHLVADTIYTVHITTTDLADPAIHQFLTLLRFR